MLTAFKLSFAVAQSRCCPMSCPIAVVVAVCVIVSEEEYGPGVCFLKGHGCSGAGTFFGKEQLPGSQRARHKRHGQTESERERYDQRDRNWGTMGNSSFELWLGAVRSASKRLRPLQNVLQGCSRHFYARCCKADMWKTPSLIGTSPKI